MGSTEERYLREFLTPIRKCRDYRPKFGRPGEGLSLGGFKALYGGDPFYAWIGLDTDEMYAAHRAAGGMTSLYRQLGVGCERLFRAVLHDAAGYAAPSLADWSYPAATPSGKERRVHLDARLGLAEVANPEVLAKAREWMENFCQPFPQVAPPANGMVFEVRQGYKSRDSKRQNADLASAAAAWASGYLPVFAVISSQIDTAVELRYRNSRCAVLTGHPGDDEQSSLFAFCRKVLGYDLAGFLAGNSDRIREEVTGVLEALLRTGEGSP